MSFFEPPPPPPERPPPHRPPSWHGPPENELGSTVPIRLLLARNDELALALLDLVAYSTGFALKLVLRFRPGADFDPRSMMMQMHGDPEQLRFGIAYSDGRKATNLGPHRPPRDDPPEISLTRGGSGGGGSRGWELGYWAYPLPPPGKLTLALEWPARGVEETRHELDAAPIIEAAAKSEQLWDDDRPIGGGPPRPGPSWGPGWSTIYPRPDAGPPARGR